MTNKTVSYYEEVSAKVSNVIKSVDEIVQFIANPEDDNDELALEARLTKSMIQNVLDALLEGGKFLLAEEYEKRSKGLEKYMYARKMLTLIETQCAEMREKIKKCSE